MTVPTEAELEQQDVINRKLSFEEIPPSAKTILEFKKYFERADRKEYSDKEVLELMKTANPKEYQKKLEEKRWR